VSIKKGHKHLTFVWIKDLESTEQAYNKLLQEKTNLMTVVGEVDRLKKELNEANKVCNKNVYKWSFIN